MSPAGTQLGAVTPSGVRDGDPQVLAALCARRGPAILAYARASCAAPYVTRAAADAFARFRALVAAPEGPPGAHPDALLLSCARRAALELAPPGPDLGCGAAIELLASRGERTISSGDDARLTRHLDICPSCRDMSRRLAEAEAAYRAADEAPLPAEVTAAVVAALAAAAPIRARVDLAAPPPAATPARNGGRSGAATAADPASPAADEPASSAAVAVETVVPAEVAGSLAEDEPGHAAARPPDPGPDAVAEVDEQLAVAAAIDGHDDPDEAPIDQHDDPGEPPIGEDGLPDDEEAGDEPVGAPRRPAPAPYYEVPAPAPRRTARSGVRGLRPGRRTGGVAGAASALTRTAAASARRVLDRSSSGERRGQAPADPEPEPASQQTATWQPIEDMAFPRPSTADAVATHAPAPVDAGREHDQRARERRTAREADPGHGTPPRLPRRGRERPHQPLSAHGFRDLALPAGLLVAAALVILAVAGVFGGASPSPSTGTQARGAPASLAGPVLAPERSATSMSLAAAERIVGAGPGAAP